MKLAYGITGSTDFAAIASAVSGRALGQHPLLSAAVALVTVTLGIYPGWLLSWAVPP